MEEADYLILGAGPAGSRAAQAIRRRDPDGRIVLLTEESRAFTNRIVLSKEFLKSDDLPPERATVVPPEALAGLGIDLRVRRRIVRLDPVARTVDLEDGDRIGYGRALVATGSRPLTLPVPGFDAPGVHTLRTIEDAVALRTAARAADRAIVVGGGLIGAEVACALRARGLGVTLLARETWFWGHLAPEGVGRVIGGILAAGGVDLRLGRTVAEILPEPDGLVVRTSEGEEARAPLIVVGVGVRYNVDFLADSGLVGPGRGVRANARLETDAPGLWAAGDVAAFDDPVLGARHHVEHWLHAQHQGRLAGENMTGGDAIYARVSSYDTRLFDVPVTVVGAPDLAGRWTEEEELRGEAGLAVGWRGERPVAAFRIGEGATAEVTRRIADAVEEP
ncbi:MAG TPA: NAD(P)/FAD-dependent oxidoreductase [Gemmatimonadota bacterium]|nr:NAD(P)/FAD-dependent oxidoreductase [Gemmatimonadota bacterium]